MVQYVEYRASIDLKSVVRTFVYMQSLQTRRRVTYTTYDLSVHMAYCSWTTVDNGLGPAESRLPEKGAG